MWEAAMKQFKALLIKEWHTHKFNFLIPSFVLGAFLVLATLISIYGRIRYGGSVLTFGTEGEFNAVMVLRNLHYVLAAIVGYFGLATSLQLTDTLLNSDYQKKCEIMHHSQPVSLVKMLAAKFVFSVPMVLVQYLILTVISSLILSAVSAYFGFNSWGIGLKAALSPFFLIFIATMVLSSLVSLFASVFRKQSTLKLILTLILIEALRLVLMRVWGAPEIFSPLSYYVKTFTMPFEAISFQGAQASLVLENAFNQKNLISLAVSVLMYIAGYFFYKRRELS